ncbi:MAG: branched-chain amino acid transport system permease protein [Acidobacteriota bacterium]|jgi:branched-chain amino acid transport system permease protein|nr:branched-chain amino acid transport system permease protein [Acidobacteriota bacterium]
MQLVVNGVIAGTMIALLAVGFTIMYMGSRFFVFTYGASYTWAAYTPLLLFNTLPHIISAFIGIVVAIIIGVLLEAFIYSPTRKRGHSTLVLMLASIGAYTVLQNIISLFFGDLTRSVRYWTIQEGYSIFTARITATQLFIISVSAVVLAATSLLLKFTWLGRWLRAVVNDEELAQVVGINVRRTILFATALGSGLAGVAGVLISLDTDVMPTMGFQALLLGVLACVIGGVTSLKGAAIGGLFLGLVQHLSVWLLPTAWQDVILFLILFLFLIIRPQGLLGMPLRKVTV